MKNNAEDLYDLNRYPTNSSMEEINILSSEMDKFKEQFTYFRNRMLPDIYNRIYDLQKRYNNLAILLRDVNARLDEHLHPGD